jgi:hypothetical protein
MIWHFWPSSLLPPAVRLSISIWMVAREVRGKKENQRFAWENNVNYSDSFFFGLLASSIMIWREYNIICICYPWLHFCSSLKTLYSKNNVYSSFTLWKTSDWMISSGVLLPCVPACFLLFYQPLSFCQNRGKSSIPWEKEKKAKKET